ncbi:MAG: TolC family protein [Cyclobacteriaceae bacterium]|jgi:outer membrane protein TolC|nr:TolC family protein [Cyclobacteriaceae bacterium]
MKISIVKYFGLIILTAYVELISAQNVISEQAALDSTMKYSPLLKSAELQVKQSNYLRKSSFNLSNPEVIAESPTGEFYAVGILQSIEFPTVYIKQGQLLKQQSLLSEKGKALTVNEIKRLIRSVYLNTQYSWQLSKQLKYQDSLYNQIYLSAKRQFEVGVIDYLAKTFAESQYGEVHNQFVQAENTHKANVQQLKLYTGMSAELNVSPLIKLSALTVQADTSSVTQSPFVQYARQNQLVSQKQVSLERNRVLPGLVFGYLNQGAKETETYYRFRVGFTVPLWFWQYNGNIKAAKTGLQIAEQQTRVQQQQLTADLQTAISEYNSAQQAVAYYEASGLRQADDIINAAKRFFESGQTDYIAYIRNINDAYTIKRTYLETLRNYNQSIININYITGDL